MIENIFNFQQTKPNVYRMILFYITVKVCVNAIYVQQTSLRKKKAPVVHISIKPSTISIKLLPNVYKMFLF